MAFFLSSGFLVLEFILEDLKTFFSRHYSGFGSIVCSNILKIILEHHITIINSLFFPHQHRYTPLLSQSASW